MYNSNPSSFTSFFISMTEQKMKKKNDFMNLKGVKLMHNISLKYYTPLIKSLHSA